MEKKINQLRLKATLKESAQNAFQPVKRSYDTAVVAETAGLAGAAFDARVREMPEFDSVRSSVYRHRLKAYPALPQRREDIDFNGERCLTLGNERFLLWNEDGMVIFASDDHLQHLCASEVMLVDGTFKSCPNLFFQLYTLHGCVMGQIFPLVFCLLPNKQQATYQLMFEKILESVAQRNLVLQPTRILMNFEMACINALRRQFPNSSLTGCLFHFDQCVQRKIQSQEVGLGKSDEIVVVILSLFPHVVTFALGEAYKNDAVVQKWVRRMLALPLFPLQLFLHGTNGLAYLAVVDAASPAIYQVKVQMVHQYLADVWIDMVESTFAPFL